MFDCQALARMYNMHKYRYGHRHDTGGYIVVIDDDDDDDDDDISMYVCVHDRGEILGLLFCSFFSFSS